MGLLDNQKIPITCRCGRKTEKTVGWMMHNNRFKCPCGVEITLESSNFRQGIAKIDRATEDLKRTLKGLSRR